MQKDETHLKQVNSWIADHYPLFRLSWAPDQTEHRLGTFVTHHPIYSQVTEVRLCPKYPWVGFEGQAYILETRAINTEPEIKDHNGWEICFPFVNTDGDGVFPPLEFVQHILKNCIPHDKKQTRSAKEVWNEDRKAFYKETEKIEGELGSDSPLREPEEDTDIVA
jgi:hypothetical protein